MPSRTETSPQQNQEPGPEPSLDRAHRVFAALVELGDQQPDDEVLALLQAEATNITRKEGIKDVRGQIVSEPGWFYVDPETNKDTQVSPTLAHRLLSYLPAEPENFEVTLSHDALGRAEELLESSTWSYVTSAYLETRLNQGLPEESTSRITRRQAEALLEELQDRGLIQKEGGEHGFAITAHTEHALPERKKGIGKTVVRALTTEHTRHLAIIHTKDAARRGKAVKSAGVKSAKFVTGQSIRDKRRRKLEQEQTRHNSEEEHRRWQEERRWRVTIDDN